MMVRENERMSLLHVLHKIMESKDATTRPVLKRTRIESSKSVLKWTISRVCTASSTAVTATPGHRVDNGECGES